MRQTRLRSYVEFSSVALDRKNLVLKMIDQGKKLSSDFSFLDTANYNLH